MDTTHTNNVMPSLTNPFDTQGNDRRHRRITKRPSREALNYKRYRKLRHPAETSSVSTAKTG